MMRLFVAVLLLCVTLTTCTEDIEFTKQLQSELDEYVSGDELHRQNVGRSRRSSDDEQELSSDDQFKCKQHSRKSCCGKVNLFKHFGDQNKTVGQACFDEVSDKLKKGQQQYEIQSLFSCDKYKMMKKIQYCAVECILKKRNLLTYSGDINVDEMKKYLTTELFKDDWQKQLAEKIIPKCLNEKYVEWPANEPGIRCNPIAVQFQHCLWKEYEMNCPSSEQKDSKKCNKLRKNLKSQSSNKKKP